MRLFLSRTRPVSFLDQAVTGLREREKSPDHWHTTIRPLTEVCQWSVAVWWCQWSFVWGLSNNSDLTGSLVDKRRATHRLQSDSRQTRQTKQTAGRLVTLHNGVDDVL